MRADLADLGYEGTESAIGEKAPHPIISRAGGRRAK